MDIFECILTFLQISESEKTVINLEQMSLLTLTLSLNLNSLLFAAYLIVSVMIKRAAFMAAFFMSCLLFDMAIFDQLSESQLYALTFAIYSYAIFVRPCNNETTIACVIILFLCVAIGYDAYFYGIGGAYGTSETFIYNNIQYLAMYAHIILISTLFPFRRIGDGFRHFVDSILLLSRNSAYFTPI